MLLFLAGCAQPMLPTVEAQAAPPTPTLYQCLLPSEERMLVAELFFGRDKGGGKAVSDAQWADFLAKTVTPTFPDGLTVFDGYGQWRNPATGIIGRAPSVKIVLIATKRGPDLAGQLSAVMDAYKVRFHQQSVGVITRDACAAF